MSLLKTGVINQHKPLTMWCHDILDRLLAFILSIFTTEKDAISLFYTMVPDAADTIVMWPVRFL